MLKYLIVTVLVILIISFFIFLKRKQDELEEVFQKRFAGRKVKLLEKHAIFVAQESDGYSHFRGQGYLALSDDELYFKRVLGNKTIFLPITVILEAGETNRLGGQSLGRRMLHIRFKNPSGQNDSVALQVKELQQWQDAISSAINKKSNLI